MNRGQERAAKILLALSKDRQYSHKAAPAVVHSPPFLVPGELVVRILLGLRQRCCIVTMPLADVEALVLDPVAAVAVRVLEAEVIVVAQLLGEDIICVFRLAFYSHKS
jgi:hypothetical protein